MATAPQSRKAIAELVLLSLNGGSVPSTSKVQLPDIYLQLDIIINQYIAQEIDKAIAMGAYDQVDSTWVRQYYNVPIRFDKQIDLAFIKLPASRLSLPNDYDIRSISFMKGQETPFIQNDHASTAVIAKLECYDTGENCYRFYMQDEKAFITNGGSFLKGKKVLVKMIPAADGYSPTDDLPISNSYIGDIVERTKAAFKLQMMTPHKETNDTNANTV